MSHAHSRREFLRQAMLAGTATTMVGTSTVRRVVAAAKSPHEKLNIACIGVGGRGASNLAGVSTENIVALCDVDSDQLAKAAAGFPKAKTYSDYRKLLDRKDLDAVVVATPDHSHAIPTVWALKRGLDVYCEKPLAHSVYEVRQIREWTAKQNAVTQLGTQIHADNNYRRVVEIVQSGMLGKVGRVHVWFGGVPRVFENIETGPPPSRIDYDLWIGPAPMRPFSKAHAKFNWRYWWDFGNGILGDFGCHYMDLPFWALDLRHPTTVESRGEKTHKGVNQVPDQLQVDYHFPARGGQAPVHMTWYQGDMRPEGAEKYGGGKGSAVLFEGEKGRLVADYSSRKLFMDKGESNEEPKPFIPNSIGHHQEWIKACKERGPTTCNFDYSGALSESVLLGNVAFRVGNKKLDWDAEKLQATNCPEAEDFIQREYRAGWTL